MDAIFVKQYWYESSDDSTDSSSTTDYCVEAFVPQPAYKILHPKTSCPAPSVKQGNVGEDGTPQVEELYPFLTMDPVNDVAAYEEYPWEQQSEKQPEDQAQMDTDLRQDAAQGASYDWQPSTPETDQGQSSNAPPITMNDPPGQSVNSDPCSNEDVIDSSALTYVAAQVASNDWQPSTPETDQGQSSNESTIIMNDPPGQSVSSSPCSNEHVIDSSALTYVAAQGASYDSLPSTPETDQGQSSNASTITTNDPPGQSVRLDPDFSEAVNGSGAQTYNAVQPTQIDLPEEEAIRDSDAMSPAPVNMSCTNGVFEVSMERDSDDSSVVIYSLSPSAKSSEISVGSELRIDGDDGTSRNSPDLFDLQDSTETGPQDAIEKWLATLSSKVKVDSLRYDYCESWSTNALFQQPDKPDTQKNFHENYSSTSKQNGSRTGAKENSKKQRKRTMKKEYSSPKEASKKHLDGYDARFLTGKPWGVSGEEEPSFKRGKKSHGGGRAKRQRQQSLSPESKMRLRSPLHPTTAAGLYDDVGPNLMDPTCVHVVRRSPTRCMNDAMSPSSAQSELSKATWEGYRGDD